MSQRYPCLPVILVLLLSGSGAARAEYIVTDLGTLGGTSSYATALNDAGQVVGSAATTNNATHAFLYSGGKMMDLSGLPALGGLDSWATAINGSGQVVVDSNASLHTFLYANGAMTDLGSLGGSYTVGTGINASGQVVGSSTTTSGAVHAFLYSAGKMTDLGTLGGYASSAAAINNAGQVTGSASTAGNVPHAFLYSGGRMTDLSPGGPGSYGKAINGLGQVVGSNGGPPFLYSNGKMVRITDGGPIIPSSVSGINDAGAIVGQNDLGHAFLFINGKMADLNNLLPDHSGWVLENATAINNKGQIVGYGTNPSGAEHAFLLTPVPEPGSLVLLALGGLGLAGHAWRKQQTVASLRGSDL